MLLLFELGKEIGEDLAKRRNKYDKTLAQKIYKSFVTTYLWMSWNKDWKMRYLNYMTNQDAEEISRIWILTKLNPVEGENIWQSPDPSQKA